MWANDEMHASREDGIILHPSSRTLFRFWDSMRAERSAPARADLDLKHIRLLVPNLFIAEPAGRQRSLRWRLAGTGICDLFCREITGSSLLAGWDVFEADVIRRFLSAVMDQHQPAILRVRLVTDLDQEIGAEMAAFPLLAADGVTTHVFGGLFPFRDIAPLGHGGIRRQDIIAARLIWTENLPADPARAAAPRRPQFHVISGGLDR